MNVLVDTNILTRAAQPHHAMHKAAVDSVAALGGQGDTLYLVPQNLYEYWVVCTRPIGENGLGLPVADTEQALTRLKQLFTLLEETPAVFPAWERLVIQHNVAGKSAHDAHLVAAMGVHSITRILTFNTADFRRYSHIVAVSPDEVLQAKALAPDKAS